LDALRTLRDRSFAVFVITAFLFCIPLTLYWGFATMFLQDMGVANVVGTMTLGQASQIVFMLLLPLVLGRLGVKWVFVLALLGWATRYCLFHLGYEGAGAWSLYLGVALHGVCYVFFFVLAYIYVDQEAPEAIRTRAQGFISLVTLGLGFFVGSIVAGWTVQQFSFPNAETIASGEVSRPITLWGRVWLAGSLSSFILMMPFLLVFRHDRQKGNGTASK